MMFLSSTVEERKPKLQWYYTDNKITGVCAALHYPGNDPMFILPHGLSEEERDLVMWAVEVGLERGRRWGEENAKMTMRKALGLTT